MIAARGAIQNAKHPNYSDKLRHVDRKIFFIRQIVAEKHVKVLWIEGTKNVADLGTKNLGSRLHYYFASFLLGAWVFELKKKYKQL